MSGYKTPRISKPQAAKFQTRRPGGKRQKRQADAPILHPLLQMQQTYGNQAAARFIQAQLKVSRPGDQYEQEADRVADHVMRMPEPVSVTNQATQSAQPPTIQRLCSECETEMQRQPIEEEKQPEEQLQRQAKPGHNPSVHPNFQSQITSLQSGGRPLPKTERAFFEPRFGRDFRHVRVHTDGQAALMAKSINAKAFTVGRNIAFGSGQYQPGTNDSKRLLAHELTHVVQQENAIRKIQRDAIPANLKLPCKWGDYTFEESKITGVRILISMAEADRKSLPPLKQIAAQIESDNKIISDPKFQVKTCIISPNTTRFALYMGEPVLIIDPSEVSIETIRHEMGHALFNFIRHNKDAKINKQVKAENWIIELAVIFLQLKEINLKKDEDNSITANFIVDPSEWNPGAKSEHPTDADEFFASAKAAFQTDKKALTGTFIKYGKQNKTVLKLGNRLLALLAFLFTKSKLSIQATTSEPEKIKEHIEGISEPSKVEDTLGAHPLTDMLLNPDKRKNCK